LKEIKEEVSLDRNSISLVQKGRPFPAFDSDINTLWVIHPFLFSSSTSRIKLDWEHDAFRWIGKQDLHKFETVPKLKEALARATEETTASRSINPPIQARLMGIREDKVHGASELSRRALAAMKSLAQLSNATTSEDLLSELRVLGYELMNSHPSMAPLTNLVGRSLHAAEGKAVEVSTVWELKQAVSAIFDQVVGESEAAVHKIAVNAAQLIQDHATVLTHSRSSTVSETLKQAVATGKRVRVIVTESRPLFEGRVVAEELSDLGVPVTLVVDSAIGSVMATVDLCLVGADSVLFDGSVVNKIGTYLLAMTAREHSRPFYVVCEKSKFNLRSIFEPKFEIEEKDPSEVLPHPTKHFVTVRNPYFDRTPGKFVSRLITEDGELPVQELPVVFRKMVSETCI